MSGIKYRLGEMKLVDKNIDQFFEQDSFNIISKGSVVGYCTNVAIVKDGKTLYIVDCGNKPGFDVKINEKNTIFSVSYTFDFIVLSNRKSFVVCKTNDRSVAFAATLTKGSEYHLKKKYTEAYEGLWSMKIWEVSTGENTFVFLNNDTLTLTTTDNNKPILIYDVGQSTPRDIIIAEYYQRNVHDTVRLDRVDEDKFYQEQEAFPFDTDHPNHPITRAKTYGNIVLFSLHNCFAYYDLKKRKAYTETRYHYDNYKIINDTLILQLSFYIIHTKLENLEKQGIFFDQRFHRQPGENVTITDFKNEKILQNRVTNDVTNDVTNELVGESFMTEMTDNYYGHESLPIMLDQEYIYYRTIKDAILYLGLFRGRRTTQYIRYNVITKEAKKLAVGNIFPLNGYSCVIGKGQIISRDTLNKM